MMRKTPRRTYFVLPGYQGRFMAAFGLLALAGAVAAAVTSGTAVHRALGEAMFRAHFVERSTGEIVLPALLKVNTVVALAVAVCGILVAVHFFRRASRDLGELCDRLEKRRHGQASAPAQLETPMAGWAGDVQRAFSEAESALNATYSTLEAEARGLAAEAERLDAALHSAPSAVPEPDQLDKISHSIAGLETGLASYQRDNA